MIHEESSATLAHPSTKERPCACLGGLVFVGHLVEEDGEEIEVLEAIPCRRCFERDKG